MKTWPSRRVQIAAIFILMFGALTQIFMPPISRDGRAEQLYLDAWLNEIYILTRDSGYNPRPDIDRLERALKLSPGNSLYEQALVHRYPADKLPQIIETHRLGRKARVLADALICENLIRGYHQNSIVSTPKTDADLLSRIDALCKEDSGNSVPHYWKAIFYIDRGRMGDALPEIESGNRIGCIRPYKPEVSPRVMETIAFPDGTTSDIFAGRNIRNTARSLRSAGDTELKKNNVKGACRLLEAGCQMGVCITKSCLWSTDQLSDGMVVFKICRKPLVPIYKGLGQQKKVRELESTGTQLEKILHASYQHAGNIIKEGVYSSLIPFAVVPDIFPPMMLAAIFFMLLSLLLWGFLAFARRIKSSDTFTASAWDEGWLVRLLIMVMLPLPAMTEAVALFYPSAFEKFPGLSSIFLYSEGKLCCAIAALILIGMQTAVAAPVLRKLHRAYDEAEGQATSFARFLFRSPLPVKAWVGRQISAAFAGEALFILCLAMLVVIVYKPLVGCQPWQPNRLPSNYMAQQTQFVKEQTSGLKLNLGFGPEGRQSN